MKTTQEPVASSTRTDNFDEFLHTINIRDVGRPFGAMSRSSHLGMDAGSRRMSMEFGGMVV